MVSEFTFEGAPRFSYGWVNPNHAGAVLASFLPFTWAIVRVASLKRRIWGLVTLGEVVLAIMLALTLSRGALAAWIASIAYFAFFWIKNEKKSLIYFLLPRFALLCCALIFTELGHRSVHVISGDSSVANRIDLWCGGLKLICSSPFEGWGQGRAGIEYMQWFQYPATKVVHFGMVNSYLHVAVESGLPSLLLWIFGLCFPICISLASRAYVSAPGLRILICGNGAGVFAFAVASIFSTLIIIPSVIWVPVAMTLTLIGAVVATGLDGSVLCKSLITSILISSLLVALTWTASCLTAHQSALGIKRHRNKSVQLTSREGKGRKVITLSADDVVLGVYYGKSARELVEQQKDKIGKTIVQRRSVAPTSDVQSDLLILFGSEAANVSNDLAQDTIVVFPSVKIPERPLTRPALIILPEYDEVGFSGQWQHWATLHSIPTQVISGCGQNVTGRLDVIVKAIGDNLK